jgi:hypothetical protein
MEETDGEKLQSIKLQYLKFVEARHQRLALRARVKAHPTEVSGDDVADVGLNERAKLSALLVTLERLFLKEAHPSIEG